MPNPVLGPVKSIGVETILERDRRLRPTLSWPHLIAMGIGAIVGTGIYTLTGVGAERAGALVGRSMLAMTDVSLAMPA